MSYLPNSFITNKAPLSVKDFGAKGDGSTNDTTAIHNTITSLSSGGQAYLPSGTYLITNSSLIPQGTNISIIGENKYSTIIKASGSTSTLIALSQLSQQSNYISFENLTLDGNATSSIVEMDGFAVQRVSFKNCRIINYDAGFGLFLRFASYYNIEDCEFYTQGTSAGTAIQVQDSTDHITIRNNKIRWGYNGILCSSTGGSTDIADVTDHLLLEGNQIDLGWWILPFVSANSGSTVSYSSTILTDTAATFGSIGSRNTVRVMPVRQSGNITAADETYFSDSSATFITNGVIPGEIVVSGTSFAVVNGVDSETLLRLEGWLDLNTRQPKASPSTGASYTCYQVILGEVASNTGTTITVTRWFDLNGNSITPSAHTRYELLGNHPNYALHCEDHARNTKIINNTIIRSWSDSISYFGTKAIIANNTVRDGQDVGITLNADATSHGWNLVSNNKVEHSGSMGIETSSMNNIVANNMIVGNGWVNLADNTFGSLSVYSQNPIITNNFIDGYNLPQAANGILLFGSVNAFVSGNRVINTTFGTTINDHDAIINTGLQLRDNITAYNHVGNQIQGHDYGILTGSGSPNGSFYASAGTLYRDLTNGNIYYKKNSSFDNNGWFLGTGTLGANFSNDSSTLTFGTIPSTTGTIKINKIGLSGVGTVIGLRNNANSADIKVISSDTSDELFFGDTTNSANTALDVKSTGSVLLRTGGTNQVSVNGSTSIINIPNFALSFSGAAVASAGLTRFPNASSIMKARNAANSGDISVITVDSSNEIVIGDITQAVNTFLESTTTCGMLAGSNLLNWNASGLGLNNNTISWTNLVSSPIIKQADQTTNAQDGRNLAIQAQNSTGTTTVGGGLILTSGTGTTTAGNLLLQTGGSTKLTLSPTSFTSTIPVIRPKRSDTSNTVSILTSDFTVLLNPTVSAATTVNLPASPPDGMNVVIKDFKGIAAIYNITIVPSAGQTIDGDSSKLIYNNYGSMELIFHTATTTWGII